MHLELPGARIAYEDTGGHGVPVLFLHAGTGSTPMWAFQLRAFSEAGYRCIAYDRRGHGRTEASEGGAAADDLQALVESLGIDRFHLVGTAAGGIVAIDYALSFAQRLRSLAIANSIGGVQDEDYLELQRRLRPAPQFAALPPEVRELGPSYRAANPDGTRQWIELEQASRPGGAASLPKTRNRIMFAALEAMSLPTLLLTGDGDLYAPPPVLQLFRKRIKNSEALVIPECGHSAYWEQPELFNRAVLDFIGKH